MLRDQGQADQALDGLLQKRCTSRSAVEGKRLAGWKVEVGVFTSRHVFSVGFGLHPRSWSKDRAGMGEKRIGKTPHIRVLADR